MIQPTPLKTQIAPPVKKYQPPVDLNIKKDADPTMTNDSKIMWVSLGIVIGTVVTLISVIIVNQLLFQNKKPEVVVVTPTPIFIPTPIQATPTEVPSPIINIEESNEIQKHTLYGDFCNGYTVQQANCQIITQLNQNECQTIPKVEKPYCNIVKLENSELTVLAELPIKTTGGPEIYSYMLGKQDNTKTYIIEKIESNENDSKTFNVNEFDITMNVLNSNTYSFEYKDSCLAIEYDSLDVPIKIGLNPSPEYLSVCQESKLSPEIKGQFAQLLSYF